MEEIKNLIFKLLKKKPNWISTIDEKEINVYYNDDISLGIYNYNGFEYQLRINNFYFTDELSEREFMEMKWKLSDWKDVLEKEAINKLSEFVDSPNGTMDDLLND